MDNTRFYEEGDFLQNIKFHEEESYFQEFSLRNYAIFCMYLLPSWSLEYLLEEALFSTQYFCISTTITQSCFLQDELDALCEGDILSFWAAVEEEAHHKSGLKDLKLGGDTAVKATKMQRRLSNGSEERPLLTFELVSPHFCMPIKEAARELQVGLTHLKRRCRELGIPRWPHRKVKSLQTLIKNVQELGEDGGRTRSVVEMLQQTKKLMEERPGDVELDHETKVLRQACFKENYKRRRLMALEG